MEDPPGGRGARGGRYTRSMDLTCPYCERVVDVLGLSESDVELVGDGDVTTGAGVEVNPAK